MHKTRPRSQCIRDVSKKGYAQLQSRQIRGVTNIAFPVLGTSGQAIAVLNIPYIERIDKKVTPSIAAVKEIAARNDGSIIAADGGHA